MIHPNCDHDCTSNCRHEGCNCLCGEFHDSATPEEIQEALADELRDTRIDTVKMLLRMYVQGESARKLASSIVDNLFPEITKEEQNEIQEETTSMEEKSAKLDPVAVNELSERN